MGVLDSYRELLRQFDSTHGPGAARRDALATLVTLAAVALQAVAAAIMFGEGQ